MRTVLVYQLGGLLTNEIINRISFIKSCMFTIPIFLKFSEIIQLIEGDDSGYAQRGKGSGLNWIMADFTRCWLLSNHRLAKCAQIRLLGESDNRYSTEQKVSGIVKNLHEYNHKSWQLKCLSARINRLQFQQTAKYSIQFYDPGLTGVRCVLLNRK